MALSVPGDDEDVWISLSQRGVKTDSDDERSQDEAKQGGRPSNFVKGTSPVSLLGLESGVQLKPEKETERLIIYSKRW